MPAPAKESRERGKQAADMAVEELRQTAESAERVVGSAEDTVRSGLTAASQTFQRATDQFARTFALAGHPGDALVEQATQNLEVAAKCGTILTESLQDLSRQWLDLMRDQVQLNVEGLDQLARCQTPQDLVRLQNRLLRDSVRHAIDNGRQMAEMSMRAAEEASRTMNAEARQPPERIRRAA